MVGIILIYGAINDKGELLARTHHRLRKRECV